MTPPRHERESARCVAMPLGGVGTGSVAICGDGALRQWQLLGRPNHRGHVPDSFFAIRCMSSQSPYDVSMILQSEQACQEHVDPAPLVSDGLVPPSQRALVRRFGGVAATAFEAAYPIARISFEDERLPLSIALRAWSPLVPLDEAASSLPVAQFAFELANETDAELAGCVAATLQNSLGWDGLTELESSASPLYGGNVNRLRCDDEGAWVVMENPTLADDDARAGQCVLAASGPLVLPFERWAAPEELMGYLRGTVLGEDMPWRSTREYVRGRGRLPAATQAAGPSPVGRTWNAGLAIPFRLTPGERAEARFTIAWHYPNRFVDFQQLGPPRDYGASRFWLGNAYAEPFLDAEHILRHIREHGEGLERATARWAQGFAEASFEPEVAEGIAAQPVPLRTPTTFVAADGRLFGFEGCLGESTAMWSGDRGGSCALNCSHVWNYEQALSRLFPRLERTMRETELEVAQAPDGSIAHRILVPLYLPQLNGVEIGGPSRPALDGMLGCPLKVYRELRQGAGLEWLRGLWPRLVRLMEHVDERWDAAGDGVLRGEQPNTYDMSFHGANTYMGSLWLAALLAFARLAELVDEPALASARRAKFRQARSAYDELLWADGYYVQERVDGRDYQYGLGCLSDQLLGQWWASQLGLGHVLPEDHVTSALRSIVRHNFRAPLGDVEHRERAFADGADAGLVNCTWPRGGRPERPLLYCDEVWTGTEYAVAELCLREGLREEGMSILRAVRRRHDGTRRNPFNEIEAGDHYARAMSGWTVLETLGGWSWNGLDRALEVRAAAAGEDARTPFVAGGGWGEISRRGGGEDRELRVSCHRGRIEIARVLLDPPLGAREARATIDGGTLDVRELAPPGEPDAIAFAPALVLEPGSTLTVRWTAPSDA